MLHRLLTYSWFSHLQEKNADFINSAAVLTLDNREELLAQLIQ